MTSPVDMDGSGSTKEVLKSVEIRSLISGKSYKAAVDQCDTLISSGQTEAEYYFLKALALFLMNKIKAAQQPLLQAIDRNAYSPEYLALLAALYSRRRMYEESATVSGQALELDANDLQSLRLNALALTRLFKLQEAQGVLQKWIRLRQEGSFTKREYILSHEDPEQLFELALTVDPFKTKNRRDAFDSIKEREYPMIKRLWKGSWTEFMIGAMTIAGVISVILFFFRDAATYRSFSLLILACLWLLAGRSESMITLTNLPFLFPAPFRSFPQRRDITFSIAGIVFFSLFVLGFWAWHVDQSVIGLIMAIISACICGVRQSPSALELKKPFTIPKPKESSRKNGNQPVVIDTTRLQDVPYDQLFMVARGRLKIFRLIMAVAKHWRYFFYLTAAVSVGFFVLSYANVPVDSRILFVVLLTGLFLFLFVFSANSLLSVPLLLPSGMSRFVPSKRILPGYLTLLAQVGYIASMVAWLVQGNAQWLWVTGLCFMVLCWTIVKPGKATLEDETNREALTAYIGGLFK